MENGQVCSGADVPDGFPPFQTVGVHVSHPARFQGDEKKGQKDGIPCSLENYIELVDATGRIIRQDKRGAIEASLNPILDRLSIDADTWLHIATTFEDSCGPWVGGNTRLAQACDNTGKHWVCATEGNQRMYLP